MNTPSVVGIDEVGRGAWAGPLLVVVARAKSTLPYGLADSKVLSKKAREILVPQLLVSCDFGEGWVEPAEIDALGLTEAMELAVARALSMLGCELSSSIVMDGAINYCDPGYTNVQCVPKADALYPIVSAASIHAKVLRDEHMRSLGKLHPGYGFDVHVGYGTKVHSEALKQLGVSPIHRKSYKPIRVYA